MHVWEYNSELDGIMSQVNEQVYIESVDLNRVNLAAVWPINLDILRLLYQ